jgi:hypothetical protein
MKLSQFIDNLQKLEAEHGGELEVFSVHGASGASSELSNAFFDDDAPAKGHDCGELAEYESGRGYIWIYEGN